MSRDERLAPILSATNGPRGATPGPAVARPLAAGAQDYGSNCTVALFSTPGAR